MSNSTVSLLPFEQQGRLKTVKSEPKKNWKIVPEIRESCKPYYVIYRRRWFFFWKPEAMTNHKEEAIAALADLNQSY